MIEVNNDEEFDDKSVDIPSPEFVENCYQMTTRSLSRNLLTPSFHVCTPDPVYKCGIAPVWKGNEYIEMTYEVLWEDIGEYFQVFVQWYTDKSHGMQEILVETLPTTFGERPYLVCDCGKRGTLYLRTDINYWACRECHNLRYELSYINKRGLFGRLRYYLNQRNKIDIRNAKLRRISYAGQLTRRAKGIMNMAIKSAIGIELFNSKEKIEAE